jgi:hypothetical protein
MKPGSVIVDMAAEQGGNCELTEPGQSVVKHGVTIVGYTDLASRLARQSSTLYGTNLFRLSEELCKTKDGVINVNMEDDAIRGLTVIKDGEITWPAPPLKQAAPPPPKPAAAVAEKKGWPRPRQQRTHASQNAGHLFAVAAIGVLVHWCLRTGRVPGPLHGVCAGLLHRLHGGVERDTRAAHAADERDQRHLQHHRHRCAGADCAAHAVVSRWTADLMADPWPGLRGPGADRHQHVRRIRRDPPHAGHVPQISHPEEKGTRTCLKAFPTWPTWVRPFCSS